MTAVEFTTIAAMFASAVGAVFCFGYAARCRTSLLREFIASAGVLFSLFFLLYISAYFWPMSFIVRSGILTRIFVVGMAALFVGLVIILRRNCDL